MNAFLFPQQEPPSDHDALIGIADTPQEIIAKLAQALATAERAVVALTVESEGLTEDVRALSATLWDVAHRYHDVTCSGLRYGACPNPTCRAVRRVLERDA